MDTRENSVSSEDEILDEFQKIRKQMKSNPKLSTDEQIAAAQKESQAILEVSTSYTAEHIVKSLANLQLDFNRTIDDISRKMLDESDKLETCRKAIAIQQNNLRDLNNIKSALGALNLLKQNHRLELETLEAEWKQQMSQLQVEIAATRLKWKNEQKEFETAVKEQKQLQAKDRKKKEADYQYEIDRKRKLELDALLMKKQALEKSLLEKEQEYAEDWLKREARLDQQRAAVEELKSKVAAFPNEIEQAVNSARANLIEELQVDARIKAELFEKDVEAKNKLFLVQIQSLEENIQHQRKQIEDLSRQLQAVLKENQSMANTTVEGSKKMSQSRGVDNE
ncbi:MAG: hypothetical protein ACOY90_18930 [Candidatus Zhuqueibacterota bacterium]